MSSSPSTSSPLAERQGNYPAIPENNIRNRFSASNLHIAGEYISGSNVSPTSTFSEASTYPSRSVFRSVMSTTVTPAGTPPTRKVVVRSDPTLVTCFDPSDKGLYDLWAPKN